MVTGASTASQTFFFFFPRDMAPFRPQICVRSPNEVKIKVDAVICRGSACATAACRDSSGRVLQIMAEGIPPTEPELAEAQAIRLRLQLAAGIASWINDGRLVPCSSLIRSHARLNLVFERQVRVVKLPTRLHQPNSK